MIDHGQHVAAIFDLDRTITKYDTYLAFLLGYLQRHPARLMRAVLLPFSVVIYWLDIRDNTWLKKTFLSAIIGGATHEQVDHWVKIFLSKLLENGIRPGALEAIQRHRNAGHHLILVTASFDFYVKKLGKAMGFDSIICTQSVWDENGRLKGELKEGNCYGPIKLERLKAYFSANRELWKIFAYSDHHSDLPILEWADKAIAVNPTQQLSELAEKHRYLVQDWDNTDLPIIE